MELSELFQVSSTTSSSNAMGTTIFGIGSSPALVAGEVIVAVAGIVIVGTILSKLVGSLASRAGASKQVVSSIRQWIGVLMIIIGVAAVASLTGLSSQLTTLTISGIAGLGITLALQTTLSNIIAGVFLLQDGVIRIGDDIAFQGTQGEIVKLNLRTTWVKTREGVIIVIGNNNLAAGPIVNYTAKARLEKRLQV
ncbi:MAG: mechanosensitive ion channel family protein [Thaumarchaeota archaeon]|nr:mechanosensitive ion channel family protein [Nitrososphaerota archaeon]